MAKRAKTTKKKTTKRKTTRKKKAAHTELVPTENADPDQLETQIRVWDSYARHQSRRKVAEELEISESVVRRVLDMDRPQLRAMMEEAFERIVSDWEESGARSLRLVKALLTLYEGQLAEIARAAEEGRMTSICGPDGYPLPVMNAIEFLVQTKMMDQLVKLAGQATAISNGFRGGQLAGKDEEGEGPARPGVFDFNRMSDAEIAQVIKDANMTVPPTLRRKVDNLLANDSKAG